MDFVYESLPSRVVFGRGASRSQLADEVAGLGLSRVMLIATEAENTLADELSAPFADRVVVRFTNVRPHVPDTIAAEAREVAAANDVDGLVSIGGGSTTGTAKIVALTTGLPILAVPTTYAGSEMTPVWGMTTAARKETGTDRRVLPRTVVYDPDLVATLPTGLAVASGLNAMAHCVEAYWTPKSNPLIAAIATEGVRALGEGLRGVRGDEAEHARGRLLYGAFLAGSSFAAAGSGLHHKICHALGGAFDLPHAETHAVVLPHVLAFNEPAVPEAAAAMALAFGGASASAGLAALYADIGAPRTLADLGLTPEQLAEAIDIVTAKLPMENPRPVDRDAVTEILTAAYGH